MNVICAPYNESFIVSECFLIHRSSDDNIELCLVQESSSTPLAYIRAKRNPTFNNIFNVTMSFAEKSFGAYIYSFCMMACNEKHCYLTCDNGSIPSDKALALWDKINKAKCAKSIKLPCNNIDIGIPLYNEDGCVVDPEHPAVNGFSMTPNEIFHELRHREQELLLHEEFARTMFKLSRRKFARVYFV